MRIFLLFFPVFFFCGLLHAQTVKVEYGGDPLPGKDRKKIEQFLQHEVDFYSQFGLPDTLSLQLYVFENRREAIDYLESINVSLPIKASGAYSPKLQKAVILGRENGRERSLAIIYHELSHHFVSQIRTLHHSQKSSPPHIYRIRTRESSDDVYAGRSKPSYIFK